jgi:hypothetical protein
MVEKTARQRVDWKVLQKVVRRGERLVDLKVVQKV